MKTKSILAALLLMVAGLQTARAQRMLIYKADKPTIGLGVIEVDSIVFMDEEPAPGICPNSHHPHAIDLGLPSGTKWACCNVGASAPEGYGGYFAWGETSEKSEYNFLSYPYYTNTGYVDIGTDIAGTAYDAATVNMSAAWRMPSHEQQVELMDNCAYQWAQQNGVGGILVTGPNGSQIFLPAAGSRYDDRLDDDGSTGNYWSSMVDPEGGICAFIMAFEPSEWYWNLYYTRPAGFSVRAVAGEGISPAKLVTAILLSDESLSLMEGETQTLTATISPADASNKAVTWTSSNEAVATVSSDGLVTAVAEGTCTVTCSATDGSGVKAECQVTVIGQQTDINGHAYVEIGGLKWATMNVGATTVAGSYATCFGDYYAWGETQPRYASITRTAADDASFTWRNGYSSGYSDKNYPTYTGTTLDASHDAATANWGGTWRTPTKAEYEALAAACSGSSSDQTQTPVELTATITEGGIYWLTAEQTIEPTYTGIAGLLFVCKTDISKRVFFPASGGVGDYGLNFGGNGGRYWSSSLSTSISDWSYLLYFHSSYVNPSYDLDRYFGYMVRPVSD